MSLQRSRTLCWEVDPPPPFFFCIWLIPGLVKHPRVSYLVHESAGVETQAVEEHLLTEDVHVFDGDEQGGHWGSYDGTDTRQKHLDSPSLLRHLDTLSQDTVRSNTSLYYVTGEQVGSQTFLSRDWKHWLGSRHWGIEPRTFQVKLVQLFSARVVNGCLEWSVPLGTYPCCSEWCNDVWLRGNINKVDLKI